MFTKSTLKGVATFLNIHSFAKAGPFGWDPRFRNVTFASSKLHKLMQALALVWMVVNSLWQPVNFVHQVFNGASTATSVLNFLFCIHVFLLLHRLNYLLRGGAIENFVNSMLLLNRNVSGNFCTQWGLKRMYFHRFSLVIFSVVMLLGGEHPVRLDGCEVYIWGLVYSMLCNPLVMVVTLYGRDPLNTRYLYHFVATGSGRTWSFWVWGAMEYLGLLSLVSPWIFTLILVWAYSKSTTFWLRQMRYFNYA